MIFFAIDFDSIFFVGAFSVELLRLLFDFSPKSRLTITERHFGHFFVSFEHEEQQIQ